jgi:hypothetical protein
MVRYTIKPELIETNAKLVEAVFAQLAREQPAGLRYQTYRVKDTGTFVHIATIEAAEHPLTPLATFKAFTESIADRCIEPPVTVHLDAIGAYP